MKNSKLLIAVSLSIMIFSINKLVVSQSVNDGKYLSDEEVFQVVEKMPSYKGGDVALGKILNKKLNIPKSVHKTFKGKRVYVTFIVETDGNVSNVRILRGVSKIIDDEVLRVVKIMPKWNPGIQKGKLVRVQFNLPVRIS